MSGLGDIVAALAAHIEEADEKLLNKIFECLNADNNISSLVPLNPSLFSPGIKGLSWGRKKPCFSPQLIIVSAFLSPCKAAFFGLEGEL